MLELWVTMWVLEFDMAFFGQISVNTSIFQSNPLKQSHGDQFWNIFEKQVRILTNIDQQLPIKKNVQKPAMTMHLA